MRSLQARNSRQPLRRTALLRCPSLTHCERNNPSLSLIRLLLSYQPAPRLGLGAVRSPTGQLQPRRVWVWRLFVRRLSGLWV